MLRCFDGGNWRRVTEPGELVSWIDALLATPEGDLWVGTRTYGAFRFDGSQWQRYQVKDGLSDNKVKALLRTEDSSVWVGTDRGISRFDGQTWVRHALPAALAEDLVGLRRSADGSIWLNNFNQAAWNGRTVRYLPDTEPPDTEITLSLERVAQPGNTTIKWRGTDYWNATPEEELLYSYRLDGAGWSSFLEDRSYTFLSLSDGEHIFEVRTRDRDFNVDPTPATLRFTVLPPIWREPWFAGMLVLLLGTIAVLTLRIAASKRERDRATRRLMQQMEKELQTAHDMQMGLMPEKGLSAKGFDVVGRCIPANHVGGDFFQFFHLPQERLAVSLADVAGHAMDAAIPVVQFSGILKTEMQYGHSLEKLFGNLTRILYETLERRVYICSTMGEFDPSTRILRLTNSGCPSPYRFSAATGKVTELEVVAFPLGVRPDTSYAVMEIELEPGDRVVFYSDGIAEAEDATGEMLGFERTAVIIENGCREDLSTEQLLDRILSEVKAFTRDAPQGDDQTVVVIAVKS